MNKNAIKKYAIWARRELIDRVSKKALRYGISPEGNADPKADYVNGELLTDTEKKQRSALIKKIAAHGYEQTMEEVAYTWFNRFAALRFMEVNGYLPSHVRVFTNDAGEFKPQILVEAIHLDLPGLDMNKVYEFKEADKTEELFRYLIIVQCNALNEILPGMFQQIDDYSELLLPDNLLRDGSVIERLIIEIPEIEWQKPINIIGELYQGYIAEKKDTLINARKQYHQDDIPFVTQLFTPDWIVNYMVDNTLGRLWLEGHPNSNIQLDLKYYIEYRDKSNLDNKKYKDIKQKHALIKPEDIRCIDPCVGSGHILCVMFDVLMLIYKDYGYTEREAACNIVKNNLWGLDIDYRASQLAYFCVMMKARQYDRRFFSRNIQPHVYMIEQSNNLDDESFQDMGALLTDNEYETAVKQAIVLLKDFKDATQYGSIINIHELDWDLLRKFAVTNKKQQIELDIYGKEENCNLFLRLIDIGQVLSQKYNVVVTNPPYMGSSYMPNVLKKYVQKEHIDFKSDMFAVFTNKVLSMTIDDGHIGLLMPYVWMFISSYEKMRKYINDNATISSLIQLEYNAFEPACIPVAALTLCKTNAHYSGEYIKLSDFRGSDNQAPKTLEAIADYDCKYRYSSQQENFAKIPGAPVAYWVSEAMMAPYVEGATLLGEEAAPCAGLATGDNDLFQKFWFEVIYNNIGYDISSTEETISKKTKWYPCNSGGEFRKWYPADIVVVNWENDGNAIKKFRNKNGKLAARPQNTQWYFKEGLTWNKLSSSKFAVRYKRAGFIFDDTSRSAFPQHLENLKYYIGLLCSCVTHSYLKILNPTLSYTNSDLARIPLLIGKNENIVKKIVSKNISLSKTDWDSFETSWDFEWHPLIPASNETATLLSNSYKKWEQECTNRFNTLKQNEEELNRIFIDIYGLQDELTPEVDDKDVTVRKADLVRDVKRFISYAVGCMMGRYSLDVPGLAYAGGEWDDSKYKTFLPDRDAIIPITDDEYFDDDIVGRFVEFVKVVYGADTLEENLKFIADALGGRGTSREVIRNYFLTGFYADHVKTYQKRPIYWLFDSGKKNGFKCLVYMHRYRPDTIARIRTDYVHEQQSRYRTAMESLEHGRDNATTTAERVKFGKKLAAIEAQAKELKEYEEKIHHLADQMIAIDLDDGVKHNYAIFKDVLAKIK